MTVADLRALLAVADLPWTPVDRADLAAAGVIQILNQLPSLLASIDADLRAKDAEVERLRADYLDVADALLPRSTGPADLVAEVRRLRDLVTDRQRLTAELASAREASEIQINSMQEQIDRLRAGPGAHLDAGAPARRGDGELDELPRTVIVSTQDQPGALERVAAHLARLLSTPGKG